MTMKSLLGIALGLALGGTAFAHDEHCHLKDTDGKTVDAKDIKSESACKAKGGLWREHQLHCHKAGADGKLADFPDGKDKKSCAAKGGTWSDHGHEDLGE